MKRFLIIFSILVVLLAGAVVIGPSFVDWNKYKGQILSQLQEATGHSYKIDGPLQMAVLPYPHLSITKLQVATPTKSGEYPVVSLDKASIQLALVPLFSGEIIVSKVLLQKPVFKLAVDANGNQSWMTPVLQQKLGKGGEPVEGQKKIGDAIALEQIRIEDGSFSFSDLKSGKEIVLSDINATVQGDSLMGPYSLSGDFVYQGTKTALTVKSGRIDKLADQLPLQAKVDFPALTSGVSYSGLVIYKDKELVLQGETAVNATDLAALMKLADVSSPEYLKKPFSSKGLLTFNKDELNYKNMSVGFAGFNGNGNFTAKNIGKAAKGPMDVNVTLETTQTVDLAKLMPTAGPKKSGAGFLPESVTLPKEMTGAVNIKAGGVLFNGATYKDVAVHFEEKEKGFIGQINLAAAGGTDIDINSALDFGSQSVSTQNGSIVLSDPSLVLETKFLSEEPLAFISSVYKGQLSDAAKNVLAGKITSEGKFSVVPKAVAINDFYAMIGETRVNAKGTYKKGSGEARDALALDLTNFGFDADGWMKKASGQAAGTPVVQKEKFDIRAVTKNIAFPFDLAFNIDVQSLRFQGRDYSRMATKGTLKQKRLGIETFQLKSNSNDEFVVAGAINDIQTLGGVDLSLQANINDTEQTLQSFKVDTTRLPEKIGKSEVLAELKGAPERLSFTVNMNALRAQMEAAGALANALTAPVVSDLTLRLKHPNYVELARIFNPGFNSGVAIKKDLDVFASMSRKDNVYSFSQLQANIGPAQVKGDVVADVSGAKPAITAALEFTDLPIDDLLGIKTTKAVGGSVSAQPLHKSQDVRWSRNAINTAPLHAADITLKATANTVSYGNWLFKNAGINLDLKGGNLAIKQLDGGLYGGHVAITGDLKTSAKERQPLSFAGNILAQDVSLEEFVRSFSGSRLVQATGAVSLETKLQTTGLSPAALVFDLNGNGTTTGKDIVFEGFDLARLSRALAEPTSSFTENFGRLLDASLGGGTTRFDTLDGAYTIKEGVINFDKMKLDGATAAVDVGGTVSLPLWSMDLEATVGLKEPEDAPPLKASFKGPIDKPAQTFGQNAMQQYFMQQIQGTILGPNSGKINDALDKIDGSGTLKNLLGVPQAQPKAPVQQAPVPAPVTQEEAAPVEQNVAPAEEPQVQQAPAQNELTPEQAIFGIIKNVIEDR